MLHRLNCRFFAWAIATFSNKVYKLNIWVNVPRRISSDGNKSIDTYLSSFFHRIIKRTWGRLMIDSGDRQGHSLCQNFWHITCFFKVQIRGRKGENSFRIPINRLTRSSTRTSGRLWEYGQPYHSFYYH